MTNALSMEAQQLLDALQNAAIESQRQHGVGRPFLHEGRVGGIEAVRGQLDELREAGFKVLVSLGERDRIIQLDV
jgi:hypothetical protein